MFVDTSLSSAQPAGDAGMQRARGRARIALSDDGGRIRVDDLYQSSPCRILLPRVDGRDRAEVVFINSAGGVAGGDRLDYGVEVGGTATALATTQASEKIYGAIDRDARLGMTLKVGAGATLEWLPQQTIVFNGARLRRRTDIDVAAGGRLLALDWLVMGRQAHGETVTRGALRDQWRVRHDGRLIWADAFRLDGAIAEQAARPAVLGGNRAFATCLYLAPDAEDRLALARDLLDGQKTAGVSLIGGLLVMRFLAPDGLALLRAVSAFLEDFRAGLAGLPSWPPRLWTC